MMPSNADLRLPSRYKRRLLPERTTTEPRTDTPPPKQLQEWVETVAHRLGSQRVVDLEEAVRPRTSNAESPLPHRSLLVSAGTIEQWNNPLELLSMARSLLSHADGLVLWATNRDQEEEPLWMGPPVDDRAAMQWSIEELDCLLRSQGLRPLAHGAALDDAGSRTAQLAFVGGGTLAIPATSSRLRCLAFVPCFNEIDIIATTVDRLLSQSIDVRVIDNWSNDGTWELLNARYSRHPSVTLERFPDTPQPEYGWAAILERMDSLAATSGYDWLLHVDADEQVDTFSPSIGVVDLIAIADRAGFDVIDFTLIDFRPEAADHQRSPRDETGNPTLPQRWQFASRPGARVLERAWKNRGSRVAIANSGGHALGVDKSVFPLNMILRHYPLRTPEQARRKVFEDRIPRFGAERTERGWHTQYDTYDQGSDFLWPSEDLNDWTWTTPMDWIAEFTTRAGLRFDGSDSKVEQ